MRCFSESRAVGMSDARHASLASEPYPPPRSGRASLRPSKELGAPLGRGIRRTLISSP